MGRKEYIHQITGRMPFPEDSIIYLENISDKAAATGPITRLSLQWSIFITQYLSNVSRKQMK